MADLTPPRLTLVTGGARSGKTAHAAALAHASGAPLLYVATAEPRDDEMRQRIARHRAMRPAAWKTVEEPLEPSRAIAGAGGHAVVLDCLTLWLANLFDRALADASEPQPPEVARVREAARRESDRLCALPEEAGLTLIVVTNEVGLGIVPANGLSRAYRDLLGEVNQHVAAAADAVTLMVAGVAVPLKRHP